MKLKTAIEYMTAVAPELDPALREREVGSFVTDSREVVQGSLFFALSQPEYSENGFNGEFDDGTRYVVSAFENGAAACVVRRERFEEHSLFEYGDRCIFVDDAIVALQLLAHRVYSDWGGPVVAITGSAGKTTAKELTAHVLQFGGYKVLKNAKNYNNGLGHPLTVLGLVADSEYDVAVLEMGMSTPMHEIARLCRITPPDVAVELNVLPVHVEHLGSIEKVATAKAELVEGMKEGGTAVLNADDPRVIAMREKSLGRTITFGINSPADVRAENVHFDRFGKTRFSLTAGGVAAETVFPLNGRHNISNALAAASVAISFGMTLKDISSALQTVSAPPQRGEVLQFAEGFTVINDSYNSNPAALLSMVETLLDGAGDRRTIVVAGEMLELGEDEAGIHRATGSRIAESGVQILIGVRGLAQEMVSGAIENGLDARFAVDADAAAELVAAMITAGDVVLVKGSRGVRTEKVVQRLLDEFGLAKG